jgi:hypothetical protein
MRKTLAVLALALAAMAAIVSTAAADFPYGSGTNYTLAPGQTPNDYAGDGNDWKFAATAEPGASPVITSDPKELFGVRGAHVVDTSAAVDTGWQTTVGRPDVAISVLDSGIKWNDSGAMSDLRFKLRINKGELPTPNHSGSALVAGTNCASYVNADDANGDGVFNLRDFACDSRVSLSDPRRVGPGGVLVPQDLLLAFSDGTDDDSNGFTDDIAGWDFLDDDNDAYDDVQYSHGTGEAKDSSSEANNGDQSGSCPNCMVIPLRVGDSFVADENKFAQATIYAVDNGILVVQEALGTLNSSNIAQKAIDYAYKHGVTVIASAADEAAQHHNWPSNSSHVINVNSANQYNTLFTPVPQSYVQFNGCTNFSSHVTLAIPSSSCSSNATGLAAGMAGLVYSAALNAFDANALNAHPTCERVDGSACVLSPNEVRQLMASGTISGTARADDVSFTTQPEPSCTPAVTGCTDPNLLFADVQANRPVVSPLAETKSYPARKGFDEFYGYGRVNMVKAEQPAAAGTIPPEAEITSPKWYAQIDPSQSTAAIEGQVYARGSSYSCTVLVAPGSNPNNGLTSDVPPGDFQPVTSSWCNGSTHTSPFDGTLAQLSIASLKARFPATNLNFDGREPPPAAPNFNNRPNQEPFGFTVKVVVTASPGGVVMSGEDRRNFYLHRDQDMLPGFPKTLSSDGASSPALADLDGDNQNDLVFATSDGVVHAWHRDGTELAGWPVHSDPLPLHTGGHAFTSGEISSSASYGAILASTAVADIDRDGAPEVVAADFQGKLYVWDSGGSLLFKREANIDFSGKPLTPFVNVRKGPRFRTQHGFIGSPVLADLDGNGGSLEIIAANMDRHVYAWHADGSTVSGYPVLAVDRSKITAIDSQTHAPTFAGGIGSEWNQGAIVDTPAVGDLTGDGKPEIVIGTNEEYDPDQDGGVNVGNLNTASLQLLAQSGQLEFANSRLYAIKPEGDPGGPTVSGPSPFLSGWPKKVPFIFAELLPVVGEGMTGSPILGPATCTTGGAGKKVGAISAAGPGFIWNPNGSSCYGTSLDPQGRQQDNAMQTDFAAGTSKYDTPAIPAVGHPAFGNLAGTGDPSFVVPAAGVLRALDLAANEYQGGQDFLGAWNTTTGQYQPGFPSPVSDLSFLTGPSIADVDGLPGEEAIGGTASLDFYGFNAAGSQISTRWPKLSADWTVANPAIGSLGTTDTSSSARKVVVDMTRAGTVFAYTTDAPACSPGSWPRFHHDNASSGDYNRDAVSPGKPTNATISGANVTFTAPGDDLLCGTANHYEIVQSNTRITGANFSSGQPVGGAPAPTAPGTNQSFPMPANPKRFVAIRAVDDQGNVGRIAQVENPSGYARPLSATPHTIALVPAFKPCTSADESHNAPLSAPSCSAPTQTSDYLTLGAPDVNGQLAKGTGRVELKVVGESPINPNNGDQADVQIKVDFTDVRKQSDLSDYTGEIQVVLPLQITDRYNGSLLEDPATTASTPLRVTTPCAATPGAEGGRCTITTTADAVMSGVVREGQRAVWELDQLQVFDGGSDGDADTTGDNTLFAVQGMFAP